jgi:hypothetical protein
MGFVLATATSLPAHVYIANYQKGPLCLVHNLAKSQNLVVGRITISPTQF